MKLFTFRKMQIKSQWDTSTYLLIWTKIKTIKNNWHCQVLLRIQCKNSSHSLLWKCKAGKTTLEYGWCKLSVRPPPIPLLHIYSKRNEEKLCLDKTCISMFIYSFISYVPVQTSFNWWIDKHTVSISCNSILQAIKRNEQFIYGTR